MAARDVERLRGVGLLSLRHEQRRIGRGLDTNANALNPGANKDRILNADVGQKQ
jgi:hypothetical protein